MAALAIKLKRISRLDFTRHDKIVSALTTYDRAEARKRFHNPHALGIYCKSLQAMEADDGPLDEYFNDKLLDAIRIALGELDGFAR